MLTAEAVTLQSGSIFRGTVALLDYGYLVCLGETNKKKSNSIPPCTVNCTNATHFSDALQMAGHNVEGASTKLGKIICARQLEAAGQLTRASCRASSTSEPGRSTLWDSRAGPAWGSLLPLSRRSRPAHHRHESL